MISGKKPKDKMTKRSVASGWIFVVIAAAVLSVAACAQGPLPAADPSSASTPIATEQLSSSGNSFALSSRDVIGTENVDVPETENVDAPDNDDSPTDPTDQQAAVIAARVPATDDSWEESTTNLVGLDSTCGNVSYVSSNPTRAQVIVGISSQGLFEFDDETRLWNALGTGPGSDFINNRMAWIEYDPLEPQRFWQAGAFGDGVFRTDDNGVTFARLGDLTNLDFVSVDPSDPFRAVMMVGVREESVIYRSGDGGATWQDLSAALPSNIGFTPYPIVFSPSSHLLGTYRSDTAGIFHSRDEGATWTRTHDGAISGPPVVSGDNVLWLLQNGGGVVRSSNQGFSFERGEPTGGTPSTLAQLSDGRLVTHNNDSLLISADLGVSWTPFGPQLPYEPRGVAVSEDGGAIFVWRFSCNLGDEGNPVQPFSILRLGVDFEQS